jgi:hypothetical protein
MTFRKIPLAFLILTRRGCAYAKKAAQVRAGPPAYPEQAALVERAIAQEKVLIKNIQQRTPLVETYIQDTRPDVKLYEVPVDDQYMLSRVDFGKGSSTRPTSPSRAKSKQGFFKGSLEPSPG